jgi:hypothetical protein
MGFYRSRGQIAAALGVSRDTKGDAHTLDVLERALLGGRGMQSVAEIGSALSEAAMGKGVDAKTLCQVADGLGLEWRAR